MSLAWGILGMRPGVLVGQAGTGVLVGQAGTGVLVGQAGRSAVVNSGHG